MLYSHLYPGDLLVSRVVHGNQSLVLSVVITNATGKLGTGYDLHINFMNNHPTCTRKICYNERDKIDGATFVIRQKK